MKKSALLLLCSHFSGYAAHVPVKIPPLVNIPYFASHQAFLAKTPTKLFPVVLTSATTLLDVQQEVHDKVGAEKLVFSNHKQFTHQAELDHLDEKNIPIKKLIKTGFLKNVVDPLNEFFFVVPLSGEKTKKQPKQPMHLNKKAAPQV